MLMIVVQLQNAWERWKGLLTIGYFVALMLAGSLLAPIVKLP